MKFSNKNILKILKLHDILNSIILNFYTFTVKSEVIRRSFSSLRRDKDMYYGAIMYYGLPNSTNDDRIT